MSRIRILQTLLAFVAVSHLLLGAIAFMGAAGPIQGVVARVYGAQIDMTPQMQHVIRILGAFMLAMAVLAGLAALRPRESGPIVTGIIVLLALRILQRAIFAGEVRASFNISSAHLWVQSLFFLAIAVGLVLLKPKTTVTTEVTTDAMR